MSARTEYKDGTLTVTRFYDAPRAAVFEAWIETSKIQKWWGCAQTVSVKSDVEARKGGKYIHEMTLDTGDLHPVNGIITEYDPPALLSYEMTGPGTDDPMTVRVVFMEEGSGTTVCLTQDNLPDEMGTLVQGGWTFAFEKLGRFLAEEADAA